MARFSSIKAIIMENLFASTGVYGTYNNNPLYPEGLIDDEIRQANDEIVHLICSTPNHPRRVDYIQTLISLWIPDGIPIPSSVGDISVDIKTSDNIFVTGRTVSYSWFLKLIRDINSGQNFLGEYVDKEGVYIIENGLLKFIGAFARIRYCNPTPMIATNQTAPPEYDTAVKNMALANLYMKQSNNPAATNYYSSIYQQTVSFIKGEAKMLPVFTQYEKEV